jgi:hypothetical protein
MFVCQCTPQVQCLITVQYVCSVSLQCTICVQYVTAMVAVHSRGAV